MAVPLVPVALGLGAAALLLLGGKKKPGAATPLAPQEGGLFLGQRADGTIVIGTEARATVMQALSTKYVGIPTTSGQLTEAPLLDGGQNALAWSGMQASSGRDVAISYQGPGRLASFPAGTARTFCREGAGLALLVETSPAGGGQPMTPPGAPLPAGGYSPPGGGYVPPAAEPSYPPGDRPMPGAPSPGAPPAGGTPTAPGWPNIPPGWIPPGFPMPGAPPAAPAPGGGAPPPPPPPPPPEQGGGFPPLPAASRRSLAASPAPPGGMPAPPGGMPAGGGATYTIRSGDTGMKLAQRGTGSIYRWKEIGASNPQLRPVDQSGKTVAAGSPQHAGYLPWYAGQTTITVPPGWGPLA